MTTEPIEAVIARLRQRALLALERDDWSTPDVAPDDLSRILDYVEALRIADPAFCQHVFQSMPEVDAIRVLRWKPNSPPPVDAEG